MIHSFQALQAHTWHVVSVHLSACNTFQQSDPGGLHRLPRAAWTQRCSVVTNLDLISALTQTLICRQILKHETDGSITLFGPKATSKILVTDLCVKAEEYLENKFSMCNYFDIKEK